MKHFSLYRQLISIVIIIFGVTFISLGIFLPKNLLPVYEKNIYKYLRQPLDFVKYDVDDQNLKSEVAYLFFNEYSDIVISENFDKVISLRPIDVIEKVKDSSYGKFKYNNKIYYYYMYNIDGGFTLSITDDSYIRQIRKDILSTIFPVLLIVFIIIFILIILWFKGLISKINFLKEKVDNLDNDNYIPKNKISNDDELKILSDAIDNMKITLKKQEEYKNQMYQNISHDFKTPLTVIKSYLEAYDDGIEGVETTYAVIKEEVQKLENKVHSLLYLNKLMYIGEQEIVTEETTNISFILNDLTKKFKLQRPDVNFKIYLKGNALFKGSINMWEAIIENILSNFLRYADKLIKITIKDEQIIFYNDGPNINENILDDIYTPYKKGINGQFGLGLSIVKKTLILCGYDITIKNMKSGVSFIIKKKKHL